MAVGFVVMSLSFLVLIICIFFLLFFALATSLSILLIFSQRTSFEVHGFFSIVLLLLLVIYSLTFIISYYLPSDLLGSSFCSFLGMETEVIDFKPFLFPNGSI